MFAAMAAIALFLVAALPVNAANAQAYWGYGAGYQGGQDWQGKGYGYGYMKHIVLGISRGLVMHRPA